MKSAPIDQTEIEKRIRGHLDELLALWWAEQGQAKNRDLDLIAHVLPCGRDRPIRVLDLCCGPGDVGRAIRRVFPKAEVDGIDRDPFLVSICALANRRERIAGQITICDLQESNLKAVLTGPYDVVAIANALHWFAVKRIGSLLAEVRALLRDGGVFVFAEPASAGAAFGAGFREWKEEQPARYSQANWLRFWNTANAILGYDHIALLGSRDDDHIDEDFSATDWLRLVEKAGFRSAEVLLRDADEVIVAAVKT